jgi:hypothetical protein
MKPLPEHLGRGRKSRYHPTDYQYQSFKWLWRNGSARRDQPERSDAAKRFWRFNYVFFRSEAKRLFLEEAILFLLIVGISGSGMFFLIDALINLVGKG